MRLRSIFLFFALASFLIYFSAEANGQSFSSHTDYSTGSTPLFIVIGDINGDGKLDVTTANYSSDTISVRMGDGFGGFGPSTDFATGDDPRSVVTGDLNHDGKFDLVVLNSYSGSISVFLGDGTGSFAPKTDYSTGGLHPRAFTIADLNTDGNLDIACANTNSPNVGILLGDGAGGFALPISYASAAGPYAIATGDVNNDGKPDLVAANGTWPDSTTVSVFLGDGTGVFGSFVNFNTGANPRSVALNDLNRDGNLDIVTTSITENTASVLLGDGSGAFGPNTDFPVTGNTSKSVVVGDLNGDGKPDLAVTNEWPTPTVSVLLGDGTGNFGPKTDFATDSYPQFVTAADVNCDGKLDLLTSSLASGFDGSVSVLLGNGSGAFTLPVNFGTGSTPLSIAVGDINRDGKLDVATSNYGSDNISVFLNQCISPSPGLMADAGSDKFASVSEVVMFDGSGSTGTITSYEWDFGDSNSASGISVEHSYSSKGIFIVTLTVTDDTGAEASDTMVVDVNNTPPVAFDQTIETNEGVPVDIPLSASDLEENPLTYSIVSFPLHGSLSGIAPNLTYTPNINFFGPDSFAFKVNDGKVDSYVATVSIIVNEVYVFEGFLDPVDNQPTVNTIKSGQTVPIKWRITDHSGIPISEPESFKSITSYVVNCSSLTGALSDSVEEFSAGSSGLQYLGDGYWQFNWKTPKGYRGQCRIMVLTLGDKTIHTASFYFK